MVSSRSSPNSMVVRVGEGQEQELFTVDVKTLRSAARFRDELSHDKGLQEFELPDHSPQVFRLFLEFCQKPHDPITYRPGQYSPEPWLSASAAAWVLAVHLRARRFEKYALSQLIQNCAVALEGPWEYVEQHTIEGSALRRFSNHWIAWNAWLSNCDTHEYRDLRAASLARYVTPNTQDPRKIALDHWYSFCGDDMNTTCEHDPISRQQQREKQSRTERPPPDNWGYSDEMSARKSH